MKKLALLTALAFAAATPAMAMNSGHEAAAKQCVRRVDAVGNVRMICPNLGEARAAWTARRHDYRGDYTVYYNNGPKLREWRRMKHERDHDRR
jgi:hypothetical protein